MSGSNQSIFSQLTKLPSAPAESDAQVGLGIRSSLLQNLSAGRHLPSPPYPATSYTWVVMHNAAGQQ
jgi:hypothetical protein